MTPRLQLQQFFLTPFLVLLFFAGFHNKVNAQVLLQDSLALVAFYNATNGNNWTDQTGWLVTPVQNWVGVMLDPSGTRVIGVDLPMNNLQGAVPNAMTNLSNFEFFNVEGNQLTFIPDFTAIPSFFTLLAADNRLQFDTFLPYFLGGIPVIPFITVVPQAMVGNPLDTVVYVDSTFILEINVAGDDNMYTWLQNGNPFSGGFPQPDGALILNPIVGSHDGTYTCIVSNPQVPNLFIENLPIILNICQFDSLGGRFKPNQLIIQWDSTATDFEKDTMRNYFSANYLDSVLCGNIELWGIPDTVFLANGDTLFNIEEINSRTKSKSKIEEVDFNYTSDIETCSSSSLQGTPLRFYKDKGGGGLKNNPFATDTVVVGIIDTGVDYLHSLIAPYVWINPTETPDGVDNDGNCIIDDIRGYDFVNKSSETMDDNGHGTHVAGLILSNLTASSKVRLITMKTHDDKGAGDIFRIISAIYYAGSKGADVINISSGYSGGAAAILENAIMDVWKKGTIIVASAGNQGVNNDTLGHYPSGYALPNIVSVAALDQTMAADSLAFFSNFGKVSVDLAAPGLDVMSTLPMESFGTKSGTSMAAGIVSNALAMMIEVNPVAERLNVINCLFTNVDILPALDTLLTTKGALNLGNALVCSNSLLDLDLLDFNAQRMADKTVFLDWSTAQEYNFKGFELERRLDRENLFYKIAEIEGVGSTEAGADYMYHDEDRYLGTIYYRLKMVNDDGSYDYSVVRVIDPIRDNPDFFLYPNPTAASLYLEIGKLEAETNADIRIFNSIGILMAEFNKTIQSGETIVFDTADLIEGTYFMHIQTGGNSRIFKFIKMKK